MQDINMTDEIKIIDHPLYQALRDENIPSFNKLKATTSPLPSLEFCDFRGLDLRGMDANDLDLRSAYFRGADLRGIDFRNAQMEGASIAGSKISGCFFPKLLSSDELVMSLNHGTRMRYDV